MAWTRKNPYGAIFLEKFSAQSPNRIQLREEAMKKLEKMNLDEENYLKDPKVLEEIKISDLLTKPTKNIATRKTISKL